MQWGRAAGGAACLVTVVAFGAACGSTVAGTPQAAGGSDTAVQGKASGVVPSSTVWAPTAAPTKGPSAATPSGTGTMPTCSEIEPVVTGVISDAALNELPALSGVSTSSMCFFTIGGSEEPTFGMTFSEYPFPPEQIASMREHMASTGTGGLIENDAATRLGGYLSDPIGRGDVGLTLPGVLVTFVTVGEEPLPQQQVIDVVLEVGNLVVG